MFPPCLLLPFSPSVPPSPRYFPYALTHFIHLPHLGGLLCMAMSHVKHSSTLYSHMPSTRSSHLIKRTLPRQLAKPAKSSRTSSSIRIEEAAQIAGERAGQIKSNSKLRRATKADLEANSLQDMQHLLRKMAKTFFLARCVLSEDGTRRECRIIPCSGIEAFVTFSPSLPAEK